MMGIRVLICAAMLLGIPIAAISQTGLPDCNSYDRWSFDTAINQLLAGDDMLGSVPDCYGDNYYVCANAAEFYADSYDSIAQIFNGTATGNDCLRCDIGGLLALASDLATRESTLYARGYNASLSGAYVTLSTWVGYPSCSAIDDGGTAVTNTCPGNATEYRGTSQLLTCTCTAGQTQAGTVWGTGTYTDDSDICRAAVHAGVIGNGGGTVSIRMAAGQSTYAGSTSNGVESVGYGDWHGSYVFY